MGNLCKRCAASQDSYEEIPNRVPTPPVNQEIKKIAISDFQVEKLLGKGAFARVLLVRKQSDNEKYAMKILKKKEIRLRNEENHIISERKILESAKSLFIVELKYAFQTKSKLYMVMEFMQGGELFYHLSKQRRFNEDVARFYIAEVIVGIEYLHNEGIIYRDLKPENILLGLDGHIKLSDFGLSKMFTEENTHTRTLCGTPEYQAPEILVNAEYDKSVDYWSIGCLLYEMISGIPPYFDKNRENLKARILTESPRFSRIFSDAAKDIIDKLLVKNVNFI